MTQNLLADVEDSVRRSLLAEVSARQRSDGYIQIETPFEFSDGDSYQMFVRQVGMSGFRLTDRGTTLMHLSYELDLDKVSEGQRGRILSQVAKEAGVNFEKGELYIETAADRLGQAVVQLGQVMTRIHDISYLSKERTSTTFYEDLASELAHVVGDEDRVFRNFYVNSVPNSRDYPVDYCINGRSMPLYVFGVPSQDKARLVTIVLQHLNKYAASSFRSIAVFQDQSSLSRGDVSRLSNAAEMTVDTLAARDVLERKVTSALA